VYMWPLTVLPSGLWRVLNLMVVAQPNTERSGF